MPDKNEPADGAAGQPMLWIGVGASAGGLEAFKELASCLPPRANATYILAQHLSPHHQSMMVQLIQRSTHLRVEEARHKLTPLPNTIYITPPNKNIFIKNKQICLAVPQRDHIPKPSADLLFSSLADEIGIYSVGVILSGTGSDGALGIQKIKDAGGICIAQEQNSTKYDGMPNAAIETGCVDLVLEPKAIADYIARLADKLPLSAELIDPSTSLYQKGFNELLAMIHRRSKINLKDYKKTMLKRRLERRMLARGLTCFEDYLDYAKGNEAELDLLFQDILISVTEFYRDAKAFEALRKVIDLIVRRKTGQQSIRIWVVGCATGEEVYTVAMLFTEALGGIEELKTQNLQFFATDISVNALAKARKGIYTLAAIQTLPKPLREKYFKPLDAAVEVIKPIRDLVLFSKHNVIEDPPFTRIDLICCRNLFIYFENDLQKRIYHLFHYALQPEGYLFLGKSESIQTASSFYKSIDSTAKIFQKSGSGQNGDPLHRYRFSSRPRLTPPPVPHASKELAQDTAFLLEKLIGQISEGAVLINANLDVEWIYGELTPFLQVRKGRPQANLLDLVGDAHRDEIRALIHKALQENTILRGQLRKNMLGNEFFKTRVCVYPLQVEKQGMAHLLVAFEKHEKVQEPAPEQEHEQEPPSAGRIKELEEELQAAREHLQTVIQELETSNEELQALNEELQSSNEEFQSTNEELVTANEELQSTNEELVTINDELNAKTHELEQTSLKLKQIKNSLDFPLLVLDENLMVFAYNETARKQFKIRSEKAAIAGILPSFCQPEKVRRLTQQVISDGRTRTLQLDGAAKCYWLRILPYRQNNGDIAGAVHTYIDYTARLKTERELAKAKQAAEKANNAKSEFLAKISHDIRTPMNAVNGIISILRTMPLGEEKRQQLLHTVAVSVDELKQLIEDILDFAKLEAGRMKLDPQKFSLKDTLEKLREIIAVKAQEKGLALSITTATGIPDWVVGDALKIRQILLNILSNAVKFTDQGTVEMRVAAYPAGSGKIEFNFEISDTGIGIPEDALQAIFNKFTQADNSIASRFGGSGLGLAICSELVHLMGGSIAVESKPGKGSVFTVKLLLEQIDFGSQAVLEKDISPFFSGADEAGQYPILIVEDKPSNVTVLTFYLNHLGCAYDVMASGEQALEALRAKDYKVVLMDLHLPGMDGFETAKRISDRYRKRNSAPPPIFALTAHVQHKMEEKAKQAGMAKFLKKPISLLQLHAALADVFNLKSRL